MSREGEGRVGFNTQTILMKICADMQILPTEQCRMKKNTEWDAFCDCAENGLCCSSYAFTTYQALPGFHIIVG